MISSDPRDPRKKAAALGLFSCVLVLFAPPALAREWVVSDGSRVRDLYWDGELTDSLGHRWQIDIVPGVATAARQGRHELGLASDDVARYGDSEFWSDRVQDFRNGIEFAFDDALTEFVLRGIRDDYRSTTERIRTLTSETPFAWQPRLVARILFGYLLQPVGRVGLGAGGMAGGVAYAAVAPPVATLAPAVGAAWRGSVHGVALPAVKMLWHQPAFLLALLNREPIESHDGSFGLRILRPEDSAPAPPELPFPTGFQPYAARNPPRGYAADPPTWEENRWVIRYRGDGGRSFTLAQTEFAVDHRAVACGERSIGAHCEPVTTTRAGHDVYRNEKGYWLRVHRTVLSVEDPEGVLGSVQRLAHFLDSLEPVRTEPTEPATNL